MFFFRGESFYVFDRLIVVFDSEREGIFMEKKTARTFFFSRKMTTFAIQFGV